MLEWLTAQGTDRKNVYIFIVAAEKRYYQNEHLGCNLVSGVLGCGMQKLFAEDYMQKKFGNDVIVLHYDDDVHGIVRADPVDKRKALDLTSSEC